MPGAAVLTALLCLVLYTRLLQRLPGAVEPRWLRWATLLALPLQPLVFVAVRLPLMRLFPEAWLASLWAPVTEEVAKLLPLLWPALRSQLTPENRNRFALALGLGFGLGEVGFVAVLVAAGPQGTLPWYAFGGFLAERTMACANHGLFVWCSLRWRAGWLLAMGLHWAGNLPIFLGWNALLLSLWVVLYFGVSLAVLAGSVLLGEVRCPECQLQYRRPLLGVNLGPRRYERCPGCRHWHWV